MNPEDLLSDVAFSTALMSQAMIVALSPVDPDRDLHFIDALVAEEIRTVEMVNDLGLFDHPLAVVARPLARHHKARSLTRLEREQDTANRLRKSWFASHDGFDIDGHRSWLTAFIDDPNRVPMSPYQIKADGLYSMYESIGNHIGDHDGEKLGLAFLNLVLSLGGEQPGGDEAAEALSGGFTQCAISGTLPRAALRPLSPDERLKALTILSAWLRMARFGVDMTDLERWREWPRWFDGYQYGIDRNTVGTIWCAEGVSGQYIFQGNWTREPWRESAGGAPLVLVGMAAELLDYAIEEYTKDGGEHLLVVQLRRHYRELVRTVRGSARSVQLLH